MGVIRCRSLEIRSYEEPKELITRAPEDNGARLFWMKAKGSLTDRVVGIVSPLWFFGREGSSKKELGGFGFYRVGV